MTDAVTDTRSTYDAIAAEFARAQALGYPELLADMHWLARQLPPGARVADIGCGPGRDLTLLRAIAPDASGSGFCV